MSLKCAFWPMPRSRATPGSTLSKCACNDGESPNPPTRNIFWTWPVRQEEVSRTFYQLPPLFALVSLQTPADQPEVVQFGPELDGIFPNNRRYRCLSQRDDLYGSA